MVFRLSRVPELAEDAPSVGVAGEVAVPAALVGVGGDDPLVFTVRPETGAGAAPVLVAEGSEALDDAALVGVVSEETVVVGRAADGSVLIVREEPASPEALLGSVLFPEVPGAAQSTSLLEPIGATSVGAGVAVTTGAAVSTLESSAGSGAFNHPIC
jgi:hypothetical protein